MVLGWKSREFLGSEMNGFRFGRYPEIIKLFFLQTIASGEESPINLTSPRKVSTSGVRGSCRSLPGGAGDGKRSRHHRLRIELLLGDLSARDEASPIPTAPRKQTPLTPKLINQGSVVDFVMPGQSKPHRLQTSSAHNQRHEDHV